MNYSNIKYFCTTNGEGVRTAVFVSGCNNHCKGCFNPKAWDFKYGKEFNDEVIDRVLESIEPVYISGLSILGGEPMADENYEGVGHLIDRFREKFGDEKDIWMWTGYVFEDFSKAKKEVARKCDFVVDGPYVDELRDLTIRFRGSSNQRILTRDEMKNM